MGGWRKTAIEKARIPVFTDVGSGRHKKGEVQAKDPSCIRDED